jgi:hypothetical protein
MKTTTLILSLIMLFGCSKLFYADFDADVAGSLPQNSPPGPPADDLIWSTIPVPADGLQVVMDPVLSSQALEYRNANTPLYQRYVGFFSKEGSIADDANIYAYWTGVLDLPASGSGLRIWLGNGHFAPLAELRFKGNIISARVSPFGEDEEFEQIGTYSPDRSHFVLINVNKADETFRISFLQSGNNSSIGPLPVLDNTALSTNRPTLYMYFDEAGGSSGKYVFDELTISKKEPDTP